MPTYSYACTECDNRFDAVQAFTDDALTTCPQCSGRLRKLFNSVGVVFKGSGFYRTDSRESGKASKNGVDSGGSEKSGSEKSGSEKTEKSGSAKSAGEKSSKPEKSSGSQTATAGSSTPAAASG
ncbi:MAG: FmdB family zinc ribbon protein [Mycobacterium sp.]